ncbi:SoxR reducing system RseC family protein [Neiella marina]|uniref:SoxR reducing system RseC family protein n=1 Tax=Neiella holothuriorum TaxID=2870530 RepID=A0ABS7EBH3_9GAMM|nr:SoxR reducing system RseC family protein [Neiella holothuriorum]MBW8189575.1 SoxR reducing system RseC family protein [Neiella holothuriorum]
MIETVATVVAVNQGTITVEALRRSSCDQCADKDCGNGQVNRALSNRYHRLSLPFDEPVAIGQQVIVALPEQGLLTAAGLMFVVPLLAILIGAGIGQWLLVELLAQHELWVVVLAASAGVAGFTIARWWHRKIQSHQWFEPHIKRLHHTITATEVSS